MMKLGLFTNRSFLTLRLAFWRLMAFLAEHAIQNKSKLQKIFPFLPLIGYATLSFVIGMVVGEVLKNLIG